MKDKQFKYLLGLFLVFNFWDAGSTVYVLDHNLAIELNPVMDLLYRHDRWTFVTFKVLLGAMIVLFMWEKRELAGMDKMLVVTCILYGLLFLYQLSTLILLGIF